MIKKFFYSGILVMVAFVFNSCHKGSNGDSTDVSQIIINNTAEVISNDVFKVFLYNMIAAEDSIYHPNDSLNFHYQETCLPINISPYDTTTWPKTITLAFPESGCYCSDGYVRSGQIIITSNGRLKTIGSEFNVNLSNYSVNGISVNGTKKITIIQIGSDKPVAFNDSSVLQLTSGTGIVTWNSAHSLQWLIGVSTESNLGDDLFAYIGTCESDSYTGIITDALQFANYCLWIGSGKIEITPTASSKRQVTYPDSCLNQADVVINNETYRVNF
jgi:hypothetical protein